MIKTRVHGIAIQAVRHPFESVWQVTIMPEVDVMDRPYDLRCTYEGLAPWLPLMAAMSDARAYAEGPPF